MCDYEKYGDCHDVHLRCDQCPMRGKPGPSDPSSTRSEVTVESLHQQIFMRVHDALDGKLIKPICCQRCGKATPANLLDGHHHDYNKPLEVEWLCRSCHGLEALGVDHVE